MVCTFICIYIYVSCRFHSYHSINCTALRTLSTPRQMAMTLTLSAGALATLTVKIKFKSDRLRRKKNAKAICFCCVNV